MHFFNEVVFIFGFSMPTEPCLGMVGYHDFKEHGEKCGCLGEEQWLCAYQ